MKSELMLVIITSLGYLGAIITQQYKLLQSSRITRAASNAASIIALVIHSVLLHRWIDTAAGQNLTLFNLYSLVIWCTAVITFIVGIAKPMEYLKIIIYSLAFISILLVEGFPGSQLIEAGNDPRQLFHILVSTAAISVFYLAGLLALMLSIQEYQLRHKRLSCLLRNLPSLETIETLLFQTLTVGFIMLTGLLASSFWYYHADIDVILLRKACFSILAWLIFAVLFLGRTLYGWRGQVVARWTIGGVLLVTAIYFGSQFLF